MTRWELLQKIDLIGRHGWTRFDWLLHFVGSTDMLMQSQNQGFSLF